jgi:hypothetical protein
MAMPRRLITGDIGFSTAESKPGCCPVCQEYSLEYECCDVYESLIIYPFTCRICKASGRLYEATVFDGYEISFVPEGYEIQNLQEENL